VKSIAEGTIEWEADPDFGYKVAKRVPGIDESDLELLQPRRLYANQGRSDEYDRWVARLKSERTEYLSQFASLSRAIVASVG
jgi:phosphoenolpyruvate carboxykinase (ATP)